MTTMEKFREMAIKKFWPKKWDTKFTDPISLLYSLNWETPVAPQFSEKEAARLNLDLDLKSCLGRSVKAAVIAQAFFPDATLYFGEVCHDLLQTMLIGYATDKDWADETYLAEILQYELPHSVLIYKDRQFDPIFKSIELAPEQLKHPSVINYGLWEGLHASYLVSEALAIEHPAKSLELLIKAEFLYPENILIKENIAGQYGILEINFSKIIEITKKSMETRKNAKMLWLLWRLTGDEDYKSRIIKEYSESMFNYINNLFL